MLSEKEKIRVKAAIHTAEQQTSGEIRVCVAKHCKGDPTASAIKKFHLLEMDKTELRNAVLIYVCPDDHKAAIIGDCGIDAIAGSIFWDAALSEMFSHFRDDAIAEGICKGVAIVGGLIKEKFPYSESDKNELSDEIVFENET